MFLLLTVIILLFNANLNKYIHVCYYNLYLQCHSFYNLIQNYDFN